MKDGKALHPNKEDEFYKRFGLKPMVSTPETAKRARASEDRLYEALAKTRKTFE